VELVELNLSAVFRDGFGPVAQITQTVTPEQAGPVTVRLYDGSELLLEKVIQVVLPDPPAQPKGLSGTATDRAAILTWFPNSEPELEGYYLYQIRNNGWAKIGPGVIQDTRYEVADLNDNTIYTFQVSSVDRYGRESVLSEPFQIGIGIPEDRVAPWVTGSLPASREEDVPFNTEIKLFFSENIALWEDVEEIGITAGDRPVAYEDAVTAGNVLTITLAEALPVKSRCVVILPAGWIRDSNFNVLAEAYRLEFFTGADADSIAPVLAGTSPWGNAARVPLHSQVVLYFSETIAAGEAHSGIAVTAQGSPVPFTSVIEGNKIILTPEALPYDAAIRVNVPAGAVVDGAGNPLAGDYELLFYTVPTPDTEAPRVVSMMPSANSRGVPLNAEINIYLSEKVAAGGSFDAIILKTGDAAVETAVTVNGNALTIRPSAGLTAGSLYRISVPAAAVQDLSGNALTAGYEASFITGETEDHSSPALLSTNPGPGAENVSTASEIRIGFGEDIQPGGDFGDILLFASGSMLDFAAEISDGELILIPKDELPASAKMQVVIPSGALKDVAGNSLSSQESLSFTTASGEGDGEPGDEDGESIDECFIATAAFGSKFEPSVALLRSFRDDFLLTNSLGRAFVDFYYANSPALAKFIAGNDALRAGTRLLLLPAVILVYLLYHPILLLLLIPFGYLAAGRRRRKWLVS
ncbi:MAG: Ig-like domain-containing protein, partial [Desulfitobacterium hafniense]